MIDSLGVGGGAEQQLVTNLRNFSDARLDHRLVCLYRETRDSRASDVPHHVEVDYLFDGDVGNPLIVASRLGRVTRSARPSLLHSALPRAAFATRLVGRWLGIPVVESLVNISHESIRVIDNPHVTQWKLAAHRLSDRATMKWVTQFHALSHAVAESWHAVIGIPYSKIRVIPRGVDLSRFEKSTTRQGFKERLLNELALPSDAFLVLSIGRHEAQKGQRYLIEAMAIIEQSVPTAALLVAGQPGQLTQRMQRLIGERCLADRVRLVGTRNDVVDLLAAADVFVFPSLFEGFGVTLLEAMASGLPCVTTRRAPMTEIITDEIEGLLVDERNPEAIAEAVVRLAGDPSLRSRLGEGARHKVAMDFTADRSAALLEDLYLEILDPQTP